MLREIKTKTQHYFVDENKRKHGEYKEFNHDGQIMEHSFFQHGLLHGEFKSFHDNASIYVHASFHNGCLHGEFKSSFSNGETAYNTFYNKGKNLNVDPDTLTEKDKTYIMLSGRLPPRD